MNNPKILVTGASGQLGKELQVKSGRHPDWDFVFLTKDQLSIHDGEKVVEYFENIRPDFCVNCAAYTAVDRAETEKELAFLINGNSAGILAAACNTYNTKFIHISTDYVFSGKGSQPYKEDDPVDPVNTYGASKLEGEESTVSENDQSIIIRTSWVYSEFGNNFVKTMIRLMKERAQLGIVNDQQGSPTYAADLAQLITDIISSDSWKPGIYHYSNEGITTWYEFAKLIKELIGSGCEIKPINTIDFPTPAKRPSYSGLDKSKIKLAYNVNVPNWEDSLRTCIKHLSN